MDSTTTITKTTLKTPQQVISKVCSKHGKYEAEKQTIFGGKEIFKSCPKCVEDQKESELKLKKENDEIRFKKNFEASNIPIRFKKNKLEDFKNINPESEAIKERMKKYIKNYSELKRYGTSLIFSGKAGTGKTHIACCIGLALLYHGEKVEYVSFYDIMAKIKSTFNKKSDQSEESLIKHYRNKGFLIIDEIGVQFDSNLEKVILFQILNGRYENMKPTIIITNLNQKDLSKSIDERIVDRFFENRGGFFNFNWDSYRRK